MEGNQYQKAVTFSYDDGIEQDRRLVALFNQYHIKATFNLNTGIQSPDSQFEIDGISINRMAQDGLKELYQGHEIGVHGLTHAAPVNLTLSELEEEFGKDIANIERIYGTHPVGMAYAYGAYDDNTVSYLKSQGIGYGRTVGSSHDFQMPANPLLLEPTCHHNDPQLFSLAEKFLTAKPKPGEQMLFYIWGHSYEFDVNNNWDRIEQLCQLLAGREDVFYGTNGQCLGIL